MMNIKLKKFKILEPKVKITTGVKAITREIYINNDRPENAMVNCQSEGTPILGVLKYRGTYSVDVSDWNSGTVDDEMIFNRIHTIGYWNMPVLTTTEVNAYFETESNIPDKVLEHEFVGYDNSYNKICDLYWHLNRAALFIPSGVTKFKVVLRYTDNSTILPSHIKSCTFNVVISE